MGDASRRLIQEADTVVFVVSPEAVKSERCGWEVDTALAQSKRLLPVIFKAVPEADIPEKLRRLQFVRFDTGTRLTGALVQLAAALRQDIDWIREHTRLGELAMRWQMRGRQEALLLRGDDLESAKAWVSRRKPEAPAITDAQSELIKASDEAAKLAREHFRRQHWRARGVQALVAVLVVTIIAGWTVWRYPEQLNEAVYRLGAGHALTVAKELALKPKDTFKECTDCPEMVVAPAGNFMMGAPQVEKDRYGYGDEGPQHQVTIAKPFAVSKFDVTFNEWDACAAHGDCTPHFKDSEPARGSDNVIGWGRGWRPVIYVSWDEAQTYVAWLGRVTGKPYRLLTEAEWEYAPRAGTMTVYYWGDEIGKGNANCGDCGNWGKQTTPVGSFKPNAFGLYDMAGNVQQWVQDCWHRDYNGAPTDGSAWTSGGNCDSRMVRGGSWNANSLGLRVAYRSGTDVGAQYSMLGFRVGRTLTP
jgi:formylglycine-generating enzyme required for sulfatase activity